MRIGDFHRGGRVRDKQSTPFEAASAGGVQSAFDLRARSHAMVWRCVLTVFREPAKRRADVQRIRGTQVNNQTGLIAQMAVLPRLDRDPDMTATEVSLLRVSAERHDQAHWCGAIF